MSFWIMLLRIGLSVVLGGIIGIERQNKHRPAGFRTHILVCLGAAAVMIMSDMMFTKYEAIYGLNIDPTRIAAQVVSGVGFLGAGTIIHYGANVKGLTTAASLWAVAVIGLICGAGFYALAVTVSVVMYITLFIFTRLTDRIQRRGEANHTEFLITLHNKPKTLGLINMLIAKNNGKILDMDFSNPAFSDDAHGSPGEEVISIHLVLQLPETASINEFMLSMRGISGVTGVALS